MVLVFLLTEDWFFASHFWVRALAAKKAGWRVILVARESEAAGRIQESGIEVIAKPPGVYAITGTPIGLSAQRTPAAGRV